MESTCVRAIIPIATEFQNVRSIEIAVICLTDLKHIIFLLISQLEEKSGFFI